jgi:O-succinylbenzoic acid--CoA ligase
MPERTSRSAGEWPGTDLVAARADATPEREAVVDAETGDAWTYRELDAWVATVAARLRDRDGDPGRIGVLSAPRPAFVALLHAGWRTGRELVPLNARLAPRELAAQLDTASVGAVLFDDENRDLTREAVTHADAPDDATMRALDAVVAEPDEATSPTGTPPADTETECVVSREDVPVTLFTSGSTGDPKPVRLTVGNLLASATASAFRLGVARGDRWLSPLPTYHMGGLAPAIRCALYGATVVLQRGFDPDATASALATYDATGTSLVPTALDRLLDAGWTPEESLRYVLLGGAAASSDLLSRCEQAGVPVHPSWGMTETASQIATATPAQAFERPESVGQPLVNTTVTVVDDDGDPLPRGEVGELVVAGPTVTPGYLDATDATEDRSAFTEHGFHTGDRGYRDSDGTVYVTGRVDDMIVTGGENVYPMPVRDALRYLDVVADAAVVGLPDPEWGERVAALVVPADDADPDAAGVLAAVESSLADYERPKTVVVDDAIPRTASGTVDRDAVRERLRATEESADGDEA